MPARKAVLLRIIPAVLEALQRRADELRSLNGQIEYVLRRALRDPGAAARRHQPPTAPTLPTAPAQPR